MSRTMLSMSADATRVSTFVGGPWHGAETPPRRDAGIRLRHALVDEFLCFPIDVERQFLVEFAFDAAAGKHRTGAQGPAAEIHLVTPTS